MHDRGVVLCPTLAASDAVARYQGWNGQDPAPRAVQLSRASFALARDAHVIICAGGDVGVFAHGDNARELELMQSYGMPALDVLRAATSVNAKAFHIDDRVGAIRPGLLADVIAVAGDPAADIHAVRQIRLILQAGKIILQQSPP
jgi:imidazolonepropionase-like amidohydrolase